jgi:hypothetical protein
MITICGRWDKFHMDAATEWRMWQQIRGAFAIDRFIMTPISLGSTSGLEQYATMTEALATCQGSRVFLEPTGTKTMADLPEGDITLILGSTDANNVKLAAVGEMFKILSDKPADMYGMNAAAITLAIRYGQGT